MTATGAPVISATQAYLKHPDWSEYEENRLYFRRSFGKGRHIEFYILNKQKHQPGFITSFAEPEILRLYGIHAARLHAVFATYAAQQKEPWKEPFTLLGSDLIKILRIHTGNKLKKGDKLRAIADLAWVLGTLGAKIQWQEGYLDLTIVERSMIWIVNVKEQYQNDLNGNPGELIEVEIEVQAGQWTRNFLNRDGEKQRTALYQYGFINQDVLSIDPYKKELAAALGLYLIQNRRSHPSGKYRIQTLLEAVMSIHEIDLIRNDKLKRSRFVKRFYVLLEDLTEVNFTIQFDESFPRELLPSWAELPSEIDAELDPATTAPQEQRMPDGFFDTWLQGVVIIIAPAPVEGELAAFEASKAKPTKKLSRSSSSSTSDCATEAIVTVDVDVVEAEPVQPQEFTGAVVKELRQKAGMSQMDIAIALGMSQSWVRDIENKRQHQPLKPVYAEQLKKILEFS
ncbi:helix-turn-helix transcriptional regulator [Microcoleus sp. FACHB-1515]|uniref:helix-turn-helix domain-containing protein n=1 Tax=Cyanophyceae TaxID=3028117 RepID=UPI001F54C677|nr:helix-turn-helix transcriptional regulator [Microcoleus sp. FACHB-1515]